MIKDAKQYLALLFNKPGHDFILLQNVRTSERDLAADEEAVIAEAMDNELIVGAMYIDSMVEVVIAMRYAYMNPYIIPRVDRYKRRSEKIPGYEKILYYEIPGVSKEQAPLFIYQCHDVGRGCCLKQDSMQTYWMTKGFFRENTPDSEALRTVKCFKKRGSRFIEEKMVLPLFRWTYV